MIQIVLPQMRRQHPGQEGRLATPLRAYKSRYALVAMNGVHLQPVSHHRAHPGGEIAHLLGVHSGQSAEEPSYVVLSVPLRQTVEILSDGVKNIDFIGVDKLHNLRLWRTPLAYLHSLGTDDDAVDSTLCQGAPLMCLALDRLVSKLYLSVKNVLTKEVILVKKQLYCESLFFLLVGVNDFFFHRC